MCMKKKILSGIFALALLTATGLGVNQSMKRNVDLSDLVMTNVDALAYGEFPGSDPCVHDCSQCMCYIPPIDVDPEGHWVYNARAYN